MSQEKDNAAELTLGVVKRLEAKTIADNAEGLMEREEQFQIPITGVAGEFATWIYVDLEFDIQFEDATGQRDSDFDRPVFYFGTVVESGGPIGLDACVIEWTVTDTNATTGCRIALGPRASDVDRKFSGEVHAVFQGYGAPVDPYGDMESLDVE